MYTYLGLICFGNSNDYVVGDDDLDVTADADAQGMYALYSTNLGSR